MLAVLLADRASKIWVEHNLGPALSGKEVTLPFATVLRYQVNTGAAFSFLRGQPAIFTGLALVVACELIVFYQTRGATSVRAGWAQLAFSLILGGIIGNLLDRLTRPDGGVTDFIVLDWAHVGNWQFAVFNIADSGITVGVTILISRTLLQTWIAEQRPRRVQPPLGQGTDNTTRPGDGVPPGGEGAVLTTPAAPKEKEAGTEDQPGEGSHA